MAWEFTDLECVLRDVVDILQATTVEDWNAISVGGDASDPEKKLQVSVPMHKNSVDEICINLDGDAYLELKDRTVRLKPGQFFVIPAGVVHRECCAKGEPCCNLWLNIWRTQGIRTNITVSDENGNMSLLHTQMVHVTSESYIALKDTLSKELEGEQFGAATLVKGRLVETMIDMIRQLKAEQRGQFAHQWQETLVAEAMEYLYRHGGEKTALEDVAEHLAISQRQLSRIFKTATGTTVIHYFNKHRILQARYYLISTNLGLKEIAERLSYYDQYHFSRMFKKATGFTPSQFRKNRRES